MTENLSGLCFSTRKQPTFGDATPGFATKWRLRNERGYSILMTRHYPDLGSASDWSCLVGNFIQPIRSTTQIWLVTRRHLAGKPVVSSPNVGCFLRLPLLRFTSALVGKVITRLSNDKIQFWYVDFNSCFQRMNFWKQG